MRTEVCDTLLNNLQDFGSRPSAHNHDAWNLFVGVGTGHLCEETNLALHDKVGLFLQAKEGNVQQKFQGWLDSYYFPLIPTKEIAAHFDDRALPLLHARKVVTVGPTHFGNLTLLLHHVEHIQMNPMVRLGRHFWQAQGKVYNRMLDVSKAHPSDNVVFLVSGGLPAKALIYKAYHTLGHKDTIIDVGTSLDIFAGKGDRLWNQDIGKICRDYAQWVEGGVCVKHAQRRLKNGYPSA